MEKKYHHGDLKTELIKQGLILVHEEGVNGLSLRKLAKRCGVSEAAPYSHFENKEALLEAMCFYISDSLLRYITEAYEFSKQNGEGGIYAIGRAYISYFLKYPGYFSFIFAQPFTKIDFTSDSASDEFAPFGFYKEKAYAECRKHGFTDEQIKFGIISDWAKVHGLASIAMISGVKKDFEWEAVLDKLLLDKCFIKGEE